MERRQRLYSGSETRFTVRNQEIYIKMEEMIMSQPKYHGLNELREMFLHFFETKGHLRLPSFSLIPQNDASLLLTTSGMAP